MSEEMERAVVVNTLCELDRVKRCPIAGETFLGESGRDER